MKRNVKERIKKLFCVLMAVCAIFTTPVFAADTDTPVDEPIINEQTIGGLLASNAGGFSGGYGSLNVYLSSGNWWADFMCGTASTGVSGSVMCYVTSPDGNTQFLGTISASGGHTSYTEFTYAKSGTYVFTFEANTTAHIEVYARIYDWLQSLKFVSS